jgi:hypothetical protein
MAFREHAQKRSEENVNENSTEGFVESITASQLGDQELGQETSWNASLPERQGDDCTTYRDQPSQLDLNEKDEKRAKRKNRRSTMFKLSRDGDSESGCVSKLFENSDNSKKRKNESDSKTHESEDEDEQCLRKQHGQREIARERENQSSSESKKKRKRAHMIPNLTGYRISLSGSPCYDHSLKMTSPEGRRLKSLLGALKLNEILGIGCTLRVEGTISSTKRHAA